MDGEKGSLAKQIIDAKKCAKMGCGKISPKRGKKGGIVRCC